MKTPFIAKLSYGVLILTTLFLIYVGWLLFSPFNPATVTVPIKIQNRDVAPGQPIVLLITSCTHIETTAQLQVEILAEVGGNAVSGDIALPIFALNDIPTKKGCLKEMPFPIDLSASNLKLPSGSYKIRLKTTYKVNALRTHEANYNSETFNYKVE